MQPLEVNLQKHLARHDWQQVTSLVAVSGGADSVALASGLAFLMRHEPAATARRLWVVHFHHHLRGNEADLDAEFVATLADSLGLDCRIGHAEPNQLAASGESLETAARQARYQFFEQTANELGARYLFTAHTADDQAETILHRIVRGTGLAGLAGIPAVRALSPLTTIVRPLLTTRRAEVLEYLQSIGQTYRHDATNDEVQFTRNRLRHQLLPQLAEQYNPQVVDALRQLGELASDAQQVITGAVGPLIEQVMLRRHGAHLELDLRPLNNTPSYLLREMFIAIWQQQRWPLQAMSFEKWHELATLAQQEQNETRTLPGGIRAQKQGETLVLSRPE